MQIKPAENATRIGVVLAVCGYFLTYAEIIAKRVSYTKGKWLFRILIFLYSIIGLGIIITMQLASNGLDDKSNQVFVLIVLLFTTFIDRVAKPLILESIASENQPIHFSDLEVVGNMLFYKPNNKRFLFKDFSNIDASNIKINDIFTVTIKDDYLIIRDCPNHSIYNSISKNLKLDITAQINFLINKQKILIEKLDLEVKRFVEKNPN